MGGESHCQDQLYNFRVKCKIRMEGLWEKKEFISGDTGEVTEAEGMAVEHREKTGSSSSCFSDGERQARAEDVSQHGTALCDLGE